MNDLFVSPPKKRRKSPEHTFQSWADRFIDRVVLPPMFTTGLDVAHRDMANIAHRMSMRGRGLKYGLPDILVAQRQGETCRTLWIELKRGSTVTETQAGVHRAMVNAGQRVVVCNTMVEVLEALRGAGFALHGNADNIAMEYEMRVGAAQAGPKKRSRPRGPALRRGGLPPEWASVEELLG